MSAFETVQLHWSTLRKVSLAPAEIDPLPSLSAFSSGGHRVAGLAVHSQSMASVFGQPRGVVEVHCISFAQLGHQIC